MTAESGTITVRDVRPTDWRELMALYAAATPDSLRLRFFDKPSRSTLTAEVDRLCRPQGQRHQAVVAVEAGHVRGVASCERRGRLGPRAEFAVFVDDRYQGHGIGTLLLRHLAARAGQHGITELAGAVLPGNTRMLRLARHFGAGSWIGYGTGTGAVGVGLSTTARTGATT
jgi:GNAT superfamily N-acetyltransferase